MTAKSDYGVDFHLREARRLGLSDPMLTEAVEVVQLFNTVTKLSPRSPMRCSSSPISLMPSANGDVTP